MDEMSHRPLIQDIVADVAAASQQSLRRRRQTFGADAVLQLAAQLAAVELTLPPRPEQRGDTVADDVGHRPAHVQKRVDTDEQDEPPAGRPNAGSVAVATTSDARGTPAMPLLVTL